MARRVFLDTSILLKADDSRFAEHRMQARDLVLAHMRNQTGVVSAQVLSEFARLATERLGLTTDDVLARLARYRHFECRSVDADIVGVSVELRAQYKLGLADAIMLATARQARCYTVYTESLVSGVRYGGVEVVNVFN